MAPIDNVNFGLRHVVSVALGLCWIERKLVLPPDYPDDTTIRKLFRKQMKWEEYKKKVVKEVLQHKKAKKKLKLQY